MSEFWVWPVPKFLHIAERNNGSKKLVLVLGEMNQQIEVRDREISSFKERERHLLQIFDYIKAFSSMKEDFNEK